ncbi:hypothetical protein DXA13_13295 [Clostridium sp. AM58-1XD]|nr:hypothetical protein DXA13_13295 [Clostridium sp. AM58-1XD]
MAVLRIERLSVIDDNEKSRDFRKVSEGRCFFRFVGNRIYKIKNDSRGMHMYEGNYAAEAAATGVGFRQRESLPYNGNMVWRTAENDFKVSFFTSLSVVATYDW